MSDAYFATTAGALKEYQGAVDVFVSDLKTITTGATTVEGALESWIETNLSTVAHIEPSKVPILGEALDWVGAGVTIGGDMVDIYNANSHLPTANKDLVADGAALLVMAQAVPFVDAIMDLGVIGGAVAAVIGNGIGAAIKADWDTLSGLFDSAKSSSMSATDFAAEAVTSVHNTFNDILSSSGATAQDNLDAISSEIANSLAPVPNLSLDLEVPPPTLPSAISTAETSWAAAPTTYSPLVIDLSSGHTGITLTTFDPSTTTTFFDLNSTGFSQQTAWVSGDTGLLVRDLNSNGVIDNGSELFGSSTVDGFAQLATLDSNHDLKIDSHDTDWSTLQVWIDSNGDGITQSGELHSLSSLGIVSIDLAGVTASSSTIDGNPISHTSTVTFSDASTAAIDDAWFVNDPVNSYYNGSYTLDTDALSLPDLRGYGTLPDLTIAISQDATLKSLVADFASDFTMASFADPSTLDGSVQSILYEWAGVSGVDPTSRGSYVDAQHLEFLEHLFGQSYFSSIGGQGANPEPGPSAQIETSWQQVFETFKDDLFLQAGASTLFENPVTYNPWSGTVSGDTSLSHTAIEALVGTAPSAGAANDAYWVEIAHFIDTIKGLDNVTPTEAGWLYDSVHATDSSLSWDDIVAMATGTEPINYITGTSGNDTLTGTDGNDNITGGSGDDTINGGGANDTIFGGTGADTIHGGDGNDTIYGNDTGSGADSSNTLYGDAGNDVIYAGNGGDTLYGGDGNDTLYAGTGNDTLSGGAGGNFLYGGPGNDTYIFTSGAHNYISERNEGGTDQIILPSGITSGDVSFSRIDGIDGLGNFHDLLITFSGGGSIQIDNQFDSSETGYHVETLVFSDSSTIDLTSLSNVPYVGTANDDDISVPSGAGDVTIQGLAGNDTITVHDGNNVLDGGVGNDNLNGGTGNDTFIASPGYDTITEEGGTDTIQIPVGYTASDVTFYLATTGPDASTSLVVSIAGLGEIRITDQFYSSANAVEQLHFMDDNSYLTIADQTLQIIGTAGNDYLTGLTSGVANNYFDGRGGADTFVGGVGDNTFVIHSGFGNTTIEETSTAGTNAINFEGVDPSHVRMWTDLSGYLHLQDTTDTSHSITVYAGLNGTGDESTIGTYLSQITFDDTAHTVWDITGGLTLTSDGSGDTMNGTAYDDTIISVGGADYLSGGNGNDTYVFSSGFGNSTIVDNSTAASNVIHFSGIDPADIRMWTSSSGYLYLQDTTNPSHEITVHAGTTGSGTDENAVGQYFSEITFDTVYATTWDLTGGLHITGDNSGDFLYGTAYNDTIVGGSGSDYLYANGGDDVIMPGGGYNYVDGGDGNNTVDYSNASAGITIDLSAHSTSDNGDGGHDTLYNIQNVNGSSYADTITGDSNDNILYGGGGNDSLTGGSGADTFLFKAATAFSGSATITDFNTTQNDKIDINDVLQGHYHPLTDAISDFVQLVTSGSNTLLKVDLDGTGGIYSPTTIATIQGVTGLSLSTLISDHHLIVPS
jgi:Ca2+-binding RTX toxin-like protein